MCGLISAREYHEKIHMSFLPRAIAKFDLGTSATIIVAEVKP